MISAAHFRVIYNLMRAKNTDALIEYITTNHINGHNIVEFPDDIRAEFDLAYPGWLNFEGQMTLMRVAQLMEPSPVFPTLQSAIQYAHVGLRNRGLIQEPVEDSLAILDNLDPDDAPSEPSVASSTVVNSTDLSLTFCSEELSGQASAACNQTAE